MNTGSMTLFVRFNCQTQDYYSYILSFISSICPIKVFIIRSNNIILDVNNIPAGSLTVLINI